MSESAPIPAPDDLPSPSARRRSAQVVNVRYFTDFPTCNYKCTYCIAGHGDTFPKPEYRWDPERYLTIVDHLMELPFPINVRFGVGGEFFLDKNLIEGARRLSNSANAASVNLITNLSFSYRQYKQILADCRQEKIAILATFHPTEVADHAAWLETARSISCDYDLAIVMVAYPPTWIGCAPTTRAFRKPGSRLSSSHSSAGTKSATTPATTPPSNGLCSGS